ncbi:MAG TPA: hypothetical protein VL899_16840 [Alphaproteobacteria bacterium]|nr:hypothetical protein [Alphaproteobacteria bacterium]
MMNSLAGSGGLPPHARDDILKRISTVVAPTVGGKGILFARYAPASAAVVNRCFSNARQAAADHGGEALYGWSVRYVDSPCEFLVAFNHAVWRSPDGSVIDVTPFDRRHRPICVDGGVVFLSDPRATPLSGTGTGRCLPSWFFPVFNNPASVALTADRTRQELDAFEGYVASSPKLQDSARGTELLARRRDRFLDAA